MAKRRTYKRDKRGRLAPTGGALFDDPMSHAVDHLDVKVVDLVPVIAQQGRCDYRVSRAMQPTKRNVDWRFGKSAVEPPDGLPAEESAVPA